ncbi:T9SS type A sorting domain-containing protein [candidate division KSB1 bacterium]|nr:T9SS type A sorting domain-containing protein [candidate division KSB1 bacterium]
MIIRMLGECLIRPWNKWVWCKCHTVILVLFVLLIGDRTFILAQDIKLRAIITRNDMWTNGLLKTAIQIKSDDNPLPLVGLSCDFAAGPELNAIVSTQPEWNPSLDDRFETYYLPSKESCRLVIVPDLSKKSVQEWDKDNKMVLDQGWQTLVTVPWEIMDLNKSMLEFKKETCQALVWKDKHAVPVEMHSQPLSFSLVPVKRDSVQLRMIIAQNWGDVDGKFKVALQARSLSDTAPLSLIHFQSHIYFDEGLDPDPENPVEEFGHAGYMPSVNVMSDHYEISLSWNADNEQPPGWQIGNMWQTIGTLVWNIQPEAFTSISFDEGATLMAVTADPESKPPGEISLLHIVHQELGLVDLLLADNPLLQVRAIVTRNESFMGGEIVLDLQVRGQHSDPVRTLQSFHADLISERIKPLGQDSLAVWMVDDSRGYQADIHFNEQLTSLAIESLDRGTNFNGYDIGPEWSPLVRLRWQRVDESPLAIYLDNIRAYFYENRSNTPVGRIFPWRIDNKNLEAQSYAIELSSFEAIARDGSVHLNWQTQSETNNVGFYLVRSDQEWGAYKQINKQLIPGAMNSQTRHAYTFIDQTVQAGNRYFYKLLDVDVSGLETLHGPISIDVTESAQIQLQQNFPNPFNFNTKIEFSIQEQSSVLLQIFNVRGQLIHTLVDTDLPAGKHRALWDATDEQGMPVSSGVYILRLTSQGKRLTKKMHYLKN